MSRLSSEPALPPACREPPATTAPLSLERVSYWYGDRPALVEVTLDVPDRAVLALLGPAGCGKSTLLRLLNRLNDGVEGGRLAGTVRLAGADLYAPGVDPAAVRRRVGLVLPRATPFPASVFENVAFGPRVAGRTADLPAAVEKALRRAGLWAEVKDQLHASALTLTAGQRQRLGVARALATDPEVLLLDEPAAVLDPKSTQAVEDLLYELKGELPLVLATSNPQQAARVSDRTAYLSDGRLVEVGPTSQVFTRPRRRETEAYVTGRFG